MQGKRVMKLTYKKARRNDPKFPAGALFSQRLKHEKCPAFYFPPEIGVKMKISKNT